MKTISIEELAKILEITPNTVKVYLCRSEFSKYEKIEKTYRMRKKIVYILNDDFIKELCIFFSIKRDYKKINLLQKFWTDKIKV